MKSSSKCNSCGEEILETGNYDVKVIKAKRIPNKARKLMKSSEGSSSNEDYAALSQTKFGRFLIKRSRPRNSIEITCGNCSSSSQIVMKKPAEQFTKSTLAISLLKETPLVDLTGPRKKRKKNKKKDLTAGLCIPSSLNSSASISIGKKRLSNFNDTPMRTTSYTPSASPAQNSKVSKFKNNQTQAMKAAADKQKEMDNLRKVLFKSNQYPTKVGGSLKDFLSST